MTQVEFDPHEYLARMKAEGRVLRWTPLDPCDPSRTSSHEWIRTKDDLDYLHHHWALPDQFDVGGTGGGLKGRALAFAGRVVHHVLGRYLREEREFLSHLVRVTASLDRQCELLAQRCDELARAFAERQVAEAANQALLAAWLHAEPDDATTADEKDIASIERGRAAREPRDSGQ